jgi:hypothetical protein
MYRLPLGKIFHHTDLPQMSANQAIMAKELFLSEVPGELPSATCRALGWPSLDVETVAGVMPVLGESRSSAWL